MSYAVGEHFESFIKKQVKSGRYNNASEVVREGLRLVEEREMKLQKLREEIEEAIAGGGAHTAEEALSAVRAGLNKLKN
ncbi:MAG TPA: type II toxin-antitoxin system ParD family antitoxin [Alphaproteobacteria bacterium]|nr:type II toxin-antitoxin system ParD family antitoxin [Alphaproteobacteria bacterium]